MSETTQTRRGLVRGLIDGVDKLWHEVAKFGVVGLFAFVIDVGLFNLLRFAGGDGPLYDKPLTAKVISVAVATTFAYFGNRYWTFRHRGRTSFGREYLLFFVFNGIGLLIQLGVSDKEPAEWDGEIKVAPGEVQDIAGILVQIANRSKSRVQIGRVDRHQRPHGGIVHVLTKIGADRFGARLGALAPRGEHGATRH